MRHHRNMNEDSPRCDQIIERVIHKELDEKFNNICEECKQNKIKEYRCSNQIADSHIKRYLQIKENTNPRDDITSEDFSSGSSAITCIRLPFYNHKRSEKLKPMRNQISYPSIQPKIHHTAAKDRSSASCHCKNQTPDLKLQKCKIEGNRVEYINMPFRIKSGTVDLESKCNIKLNPLYGHDEDGSKTSDANNRINVANIDKDSSPQTSEPTYMFSINDMGILQRTLLNTSIFNTADLDKPTILRRYSDPIS